MSQDSSFLFLKGIARLVLYFSAGLAVFFFASVIIFSLRGGDAQVSQMPDLTGRYYVDVHNDLVQRGLRVTIEKKIYPDITSGVVLYQSLPAGSTISAREKLVVYVNHAEPLLTMPNLENNPIDSAEATLKRFTYQDITYELEIGGISEIPDEDSPPGTVLAQFPPAGQPITTDARVFLLISSKKRGRRLNTEKFVGQNVTILDRLMRLEELEYRLRKIEAPPMPGRSGEVFAIEKQEDGPYLVDVYYKEPALRMTHSLEKIEVKLPEARECTVSTVAVQSADEPERVNTVFTTTKPTAGETVQVVFAREGTVTVKAACDGKELLSQEIKPDELG